MGTFGTPLSTAQSPSSSCTSGRFGVTVQGLGGAGPGIADGLPTYPTLGDVDSAEALAEYQARKRAYKAELRATGKTFAP